MYKCINGWTKEKMIVQIKLRNNGKVSIDDETGNCRYRTEDNNACAVGCFLPDEACPDLEGFALVPDYLDMFMPYANLFPLDFNGMRTLQDKHDSAFKLSNVHAILEHWINENVED